MLTVDVTAHTNRWRARHALEKVVPAALMLAVIVTRPVLPTAPLGLFVATAAAVVGAGIPLRRWVRALSWPAAFVLSGAVGIAVVSGDGPGPLPLTVTASSTAMASAVVLRSVAGVGAILFVGTTTPMVDLVALLRAARVPAVVTDLMATTYRLLFDLMETGRRLRQAQAARLGHDGFRRALRSTGLVAAAVFVQSMQRARRLQTGLDARAYDGELRVLTSTAPVRPLAIGVGMIPAAAVLAVSLLVPPIGLGA